MNSSSSILNAPKVFQKSITLGNLIQIFVLIVGGVVGYNKLEWRITQLEQVKMETKTLMENNYRELRQAQVELSKDVLRLAESVARLVILEEVRQKETRK